MLEIRVKCLPTLQLPGQRPRRGNPNVIILNPTRNQRGKSRRLAAAAGGPPSAEESKDSPCVVRTVSASPPEQRRPPANQRTRLPENSPLRGRGGGPILSTPDRSVRPVGAARCHSKRVAVCRGPRGIHGRRTRGDQEQSDLGRDLRCLRRTTRPRRPKSTATADVISDGSAGQLYRGDSRTRRIRTTARKPLL